MVIIDFVSFSNISSPPPPHRSAAYLNIDNSNCLESGYYCYDDPNKAVNLINGLGEGGNIPDNKFGIESKFNLTNNIH